MHYGVIMQREVPWGHFTSVNVQRDCFFHSISYLWEIGEVRGMEARLPDPRLYFPGYLCSGIQMKVNCSLVEILDE